MSSSRSQRQALYFPEEMLAELQKEAKRQERSLSWLIQQAWRIARPQMAKLPSTTDFFPDPK